MMIWVSGGELTGGFRGLLDPGRLWPFDGELQERAPCAELDPALSGSTASWMRSPFRKVSVGAPQVPEPPLRSVEYDLEVGAADAVVLELEIALRGPSDGEG
ncbi:MAG: hypothetical protein MZV70_46965 [Desulfobacterales bacterium]|nr:hypothetical protein [Desulfobacterales bacterium]